MNTESGAWYPSVGDVENRAGVHPSRWDQYPDRIIRATTDLIRERGGQVGGEVVRQWRAACPTGKWFGEKEGAGFDYAARTPGYETRELIARQPIQTVEQTLSNDDVWTSKPAPETPNKE